MSKRTLEERAQIAEVMRLLGESKSAAKVEAASKNLAKAREKRWPKGRRKLG
jgi:hypothetical protein